MLRLLNKPDAPWKKAALIYRNKGLSIGVSTERYRLNIYGLKDSANQMLELFDHEKDPLEFQNVAVDDRYADAVAELRVLAEGGWKACVP